MRDSPIRPRPLVNVEERLGGGHTLLGRDLFELANDIGRDDGHVLVARVVRNTGFEFGDEVAKRAVDDKEEVRDHKGPGQEVVQADCAVDVERGSSRRIGESPDAVKLINPVKWGKDQPRKRVPGFALPRNSNSSSNYD